jgi:thiosulfate/3-mercaptopyruvate sulfurtransferase
MAAQEPFPSLVSVDWLRSNLHNVKVLDATWYMPGQQPAGHAAASFAAARLPGARFFDLDGVCDRSTDLPHMLPSEAQFAAAADALGVGNDDAVVIYDAQGLFSSPRAWWTWHVMGHDKVAVLDGGLPAWQAAGGELDTSHADPASVGAGEAAAQAAPAPDAPPPRYAARLRRGEVRTWRQVLSNGHRQEEVLVDARPAARWRGDAPEPRAGLASGHVPGSCNVPWTAVVHEGRMKAPQEVAKVFAAAGVELGAGRPLVATCGSGTTACILALAVRQAAPALPPVAIYDGSWSEWGRLPDVPVATAAHADE